MEMTVDIARKVLTAVDAGLVKGKGIQEPGKMCVEAAVCFAMGLPHSDEPPCVGATVRAYKIRLNDSNWSSDAARAKGMRRVAIAQLGSNEIDQKAFRIEVTVQGIRQILPIALRAAASAVPKYKDELEAAACACEIVTDLATATTASAGARVVALKARADAAAADAAYAAAYAYAAAAAAAADAAAAAAAKKSISDSILGKAAEIAVQALIKLKCQGTEWLWLCD